MSSCRCKSPESPSPELEQPIRAAHNAAIDQTNTVLRVRASIMVEDPPSRRCGSMKKTPGSGTKVGECPTRGLRASTPLRLSGAQPLKIEWCTSSAESIANERKCSAKLKFFGGGGSVKPGTDGLDRMDKGRSSEFRVVKAHQVPLAARPGGVRPPGVARGGGRAEPTQGVSYGAASEHVKQTAGSIRRRGSKHPHALKKRLACGTSAPCPFPPNSFVPQVSRSRPWASCCWARNDRV